MLVHDEVCGTTIARNDIMEWLQQNWFWLFLTIAFVALHLGHAHGHGGHSSQEPPEEDDQRHDRHHH